MTAGLHLATSNSKRTILYRPDYERTDWPGLCSRLNSLPFLESIQGTQNIEAAWQVWHNLVWTCVANNVPFRTITIRGHRKKWVTPFLRKLSGPAKNNASSAQPANYKQQTPGQLTENPVIVQSPHLYFKSETDEAPDNFHLLSLLRKIKPATYQPTQHPLYPLRSSLQLATLQFFTVRSKSNLKQLLFQSKFERSCFCKTDCWCYEKKN